MIEQEFFECVKGNYQILVSKQGNVLNINAKNEEQNFRLIGRYSYDALPEEVRVFKSLQNFYRYSKTHEKNAITIEEGRILITYIAADPAFNTEIRIQLERVEFSNQEKLQKLNLMNQKLKIKEKLLENQVRDLQQRLHAANEENNHLKNQLNLVQQQNSRLTLNKNDLTFEVQSKKQEVENLLKMIQKMQKYVSHGSKPQRSQINVEPQRSQINALKLQLTLFPFKVSQKADRSLFLQQGRFIEKIKDNMGINLSTDYPFEPKGSYFIAMRVVHTEFINAIYMGVFSEESKASDLHVGQQSLASCISNENGSKKQGVNSIFKMIVNFDEGRVTWERNGEQIDSKIMVFKTRKLYPFIRLKHLGDKIELLN